MQKEYKYKAFISYSHRDKSFAKWLHRRIENYKIPPALRKKYPHLPKDLKRSIFRDEEELNASSQLSDKLNRALKNSEKLIVICSPDASASKWVNIEISTFKKMHREENVLAMIKAGEPYASLSKFYDNDLEAFPQALRYVVDEQGRLTAEETEPLAGDARKYRDREMALIKLIAGILDVNFADLWGREKRERLKSKIRIVSILTLFLILAFYTSLQWLNNNIHIELRKINKEIASREYRIRYDNLSMEQINILQQELKVYKSQKNRKKETQKTFFNNIEMPLIMEIKEYYYTKGTEATIDFLSSKERLSQREQKRKSLSLEYIILAKLHIEKNQLNKAKENFEEAIQLFFNYGNVLEYTKFLGYSTFFNSKNKYQKAIALLEQLLKEKLSEGNRAEVFNNLAGLYLKTNRDSLAQRFYIESLKFKMNLVENNNISIAIIFANLGFSYRKTEAFKKAEESFLKALKIYKNFNKKYSKNISQILNELASLYYMKFNKADKAKVYYTNALMWNSNNALAFNNLYELELITNREINSSFEKQFIQKFQKNKQIFMIYEMLRIFKNRNENIKNKIDEWEKKYYSIPLSWSFNELKTWSSKTLKKKKYLLYGVKRFEKYQKNNNFF